MKLYFFPIAPNPTKVRLYLAEKGAGVSIEQVPVNLREAEQSQPEHLARNPFGTLPVLELDDGSHLFESLAIIEYLEELHPEPPLLGASPEERARVRQLERIADVRVLMTVSRLVHATNSPLGLPENPGVAAQAREALPVGLGYLDGLLSDGRPFLAGDGLTLADCTLQAAFQFARFGKLEIDSSFRNLARWDREFRERASARSVLLV